MTDATDRAHEQARLQYESIEQMVAALECDYDRLEELRNYLKVLDSERDSIAASKREWIEANPHQYLEASDTRNNWALAFPDENDWLVEIEDQREALIKELKELEDEAGDCTSREDAEQAIQEDALEVQVRSGWYDPSKGSSEPEEFYILLCTGGPAVRILGELGEHNRPTRAWIEYQDWGTSWTRFFDADQATLLAYCEQFYFGE